jgi:uncharacterized membrane protein YedE/YeeE
MAALVALLVFLAGYATQRGSVCAVAATFELVVERKASRYVGFLFCAACGLMAMALGSAAGRPVFATYTGLPLSAAALAGGAIVGVGVYLNGRCAFGTVAELGGGRVWRLATLAGFMAGTVLGDYAHMSLAGLPVVPSPLAALPPATTLAVAAIALLASGVALLRLAPPGPPAQWTPLRAMTVIGLGNGMLLVLARSWPYTSLLMHVARGDHAGLARGALMAVVFVLGAVAGGMARGFRLQPGRLRDWLRAGGAGTVMGVGAVLVPGGNDAMLQVGVPLLLPNLVAAYLAITLVLVALVLLRTRAMSAPSPAR